MFPREATLLAASTHEGEEEVLLKAFASCLAAHPDARLIIAPRNMNRRDEVAALIAASGLDFTRRSLGEEPGAPVYLADTLGEMALWYGLAGITFVGGSLVDHGGHTPFEPAAACSAILHGPFTRNFDSAYRALDEAEGARLVTPGTIAQEIAALLEDPAMGQAMANRARALGPSSKDELSAFVTRLVALAIPSRVS